MNGDDKAEESGGLPLHPFLFTELWQGNPKESYTLLIAFDDLKYITIWNDAVDILAYIARQ